MAQWLGAAGAEAAQQHCGGPQLPVAAVVPHGLPPSDGFNRRSLGLPRLGLGKMKYLVTLAADRQGNFPPVQSLYPDGGGDTKSWCGDERGLPASSQW